tara:strand:- start:115298 stop:117322 length:2025 start_codon:yes stop_codon:yes gene_type:complete
VYLILGVLAVAGDSIALAGISPENVVVVVNADSVDSRTVANHYVDLRDIPSSNVIMLSDVPAGLIINLDDFKDRILTPLLQEIDSRKLSGQTRVVAYSAGFPTAVKVNKHHAAFKDLNAKRVQNPVASLTGLTYFYRMILSDVPVYLSLGANLYARGQFDRTFENPFLGDRQDQFDEAKIASENGRWADAADGFDSLFQSSPTLSAVAILAAENYARDGDDENAKRMIKLAIQAGWWSGTYLQESNDLEPLLDDPQIKGAVAYMSQSSLAEQGPVGFSSMYGWTNSGQRIPISDGGVSYMASCMLAVTGQRGSSISQVVENLQRSAEADRTFPKGEFRFTLTPDVRTRTRQPGIPNALVYLIEAGYKADIIREDIPAEPGDVAGLMFGTRKYSLDGRRWNFVPGAISDNLTSVSAAFESDSQTKMTELLNAGAAMTSGSVAEPFAIQAKFPRPMMYGYYVDGVTAIEAFYLSIQSPYQTLIVGDPLCQPYARAPNEWVDIEVSNSTPRTIQFQRKPLKLGVPSGVTRMIDIYVEGKLIKQSPPVAAIRMNLPANAAGAVEVRAVLTSVGATETRLWFSEEFDLQAHVPTPVVKVVQSRSARAAADSKQMKFSLRCEGADSIDLIHFGSVVGSVDGSEGEVTLDTKPLGSGPLRFRAIAHFGKSKVRSRYLIDRS